MIVIKSPKNSVGIWKWLTLMTRKRNDTKLQRNLGSFQWNHEQVSEETALLWWSLEGLCLQGYWKYDCEGTDWLFCISSPVLLRCLRYHRLHCLPRYLLGLHLLQSSWELWQDFWGNYTSRWSVGADRKPWWERPHHGDEQHPAHEGHQCLRHASYPPPSHHEKQPPPEQVGRPHQLVTQDCFWMLLLHSFLSHTLDGPSEDPKAGVSCCLQWLLKFSFLGHSLQLRRDQRNLPLFQEGLAAWYVTTWPVPAPLGSKIASRHSGEWARWCHSSSLRLTRKQVYLRVEGREGFHKSSFTSIQLCWAN